jgi:hypothetical protein
LVKIEEKQKGKEGFEISDFREQISGFRIKCGMTKAILSLATQAGDRVNKLKISNPHVGNPG